MFRKGPNWEKGRGKVPANETKEHHAVQALNNPNTSKYHELYLLRRACQEDGFLEPLFD